MVLEKSFLNEVLEGRDKNEHTLGTYKKHLIVTINIYFFYKLENMEFVLE